MMMEIEYDRQQITANKRVHKENQGIQNNRFDIKDNQIVSISRLSQFYSFVIVVVVVITGYTIIFETYIHNNFLILPEYITIIELAVLNNVVLLNIHLCNRHSGAEVLKCCIEIDLFLGIKQTSFMKDIVTKDVLIWTVAIVSFEILLDFILIMAFKLPLYIYFTGIIFFQLLFTLCFDHAVHVAYYKFICMRVHYLNNALVKIANLNTEYLMEQLLSYPFLWKKEYNNCLELPRRDSKYFTDALGMIDAQVDRIQNNFRFTVPVIRTFSLTEWFVANWSIFIGVTQQTDKLNVQLQRTKLICTYILPKPNHSDELFHLSRKILDTVSVTDCRISVYNLLYFNQRLLGSIATSAFVYITMQLQIAFPKRTNPNKLNT